MGDDLRTHGISISAFTEVEEIHTTFWKGPKCFHLLTTHLKTIGTFQTMPLSTCRLQPDDFSPTSRIRGEPERGRAARACVPVALVGSIVRSCGGFQGYFARARHCHGGGGGGLVGSGVCQRQRNWADGGWKGAWSEAGFRAQWTAAQVQTFSKYFKEIVQVSILKVGKKIIYFSQGNLRKSVLNIGRDHLFFDLYFSSLGDVNAGTH